MQFRAGGSQQALALCARVLVDPGDRVWVEAPGYSEERDALALAGARLGPDFGRRGDGLDVAAGIAGSRRARAAYVTPPYLINTRSG